MATLEKQFSQSQRLAKLSSQLVTERKALDKAINLFLKQVEQDIKVNRAFLEKIQRFHSEYMKTTKEFMAQLSNLKSLHELKDMNKQLFEKLME